MHLLPGKLCRDWRGYEDRNHPSLCPWCSQFIGKERLMSKVTVAGAVMGYTKRVLHTFGEERLRKSIWTMEKGLWGGGIWGWNFERMIQYREDGHFIPYRSWLQCLKLSKINIWYPNIAQIYWLNFDSLIYSPNKYLVRAKVWEKKRGGQQY